MLLIPSVRLNLARQAAVWNSYAEISRYVRSECSSVLRSRQRKPARIQLRCRFLTSARKSRSPKEELLNKKDGLLNSYKQTFEFPRASHEIYGLSKANVGEDVVLHGYLGSRSNLSKNLYFVPLLSKDLQYSVQIISNARTSESSETSAHARLKTLNPQTPVAVQGTVKDRKPSKRDLGEIRKIKDVELVLAEVQCLNAFPDNIIVTEETKFPPEQRHLQIRTDKSIRDALAFRAKAANLCRDELGKVQGFLEVETPVLFKSTPEGAREFLVPTRTKGLAYALPQSPQQYKQILMASGISKYYQIARCFRDEDLRADRQPEFTQLDLEMSFATGEDVMQCIEGLVKRLWTELLGPQEMPPQFPRMTYQDAMSKYGSDKPDLRLGAEISRIEHLLPPDLISKIGPLEDPIVEVMRLQVSERPAEARKFVADFMDSPEAKPFLDNPEGAPGIFIYDTRKPLQGLQPFGFEAAEQIEELLELEDGDLLVIQARKRSPFVGGSTPIGNLRLALHRAAVASGYLSMPQDFKFLWITDFPLFSPTNDTEPGQGGAAGICSTHHPFTAPKSIEDADLLLTDPLEACGEHYDIVVNGVELGGGSRRIHDGKVQEFVLREVLKMSDERLEDFRHLLEVLRAGCPPHAGIALGFDRLIAVMLGRDSVRDVIAFPKSGKGEDLLVKSPNPMTREQLRIHHLRLDD